MVPGEWFMVHLRLIVWWGAPHANTTVTPGPRGGPAGTSYGTDARMPRGGRTPSSVTVTWVADGASHPIVTCACAGSCVKQLNDVGALNIASAGPPCGVVTVGAEVLGAAAGWGMPFDDDAAPPEQAASVPAASPDTRRAAVHDGQPFRPRLRNRGRIAHRSR